MLAQGRGRWAVSLIPKLIPIFSAFFTRPPPHSFLVWPVFSFDAVLSRSLRNTSEIHSKNPPATHAKPVPSWPSWICICTEPACRIIIESTFPLLLEQFKGDVEVGLSIPHFHVYWLNCMLQDGSLPRSCCLGFVTLSCLTLGRIAWRAKRTSVWEARKMVVEYAVYFVAVSSGTCQMPFNRYPMSVNVLPISLLVTGHKSSSWL